ncbi:MAG: hypothetical protein ABH821_04960 [archaeon]
MSQNDFVIGLGKVFSKPRKYRTNKAVNAVKAFFGKHKRKQPEDVLLSNEVNEFLWRKGIEKPPRKINVTIKEEGSKLRVFLKDGKELKQLLAKEAKKKKEKEKKPEKKEDEKAGKKELSPEEKIKEEKLKEKREKEKQAEKAMLKK